MDKELLTDRYEILAALAEPYAPRLVKWRPGKTFAAKGGGKRCIALAYIDARDVIHRFDEVVGPHRWYETFRAYGQLVICRIAVDLYNNPDISPRHCWPAREDGAGMTQVAAEKGGLSSARKRAAAVWGVGLYLYSLGMTYAEYDERKKRIPDAELFRLCQELPAWAQPGGTKEPTEDEASERALNQREERHESTPADDANMAAIDEFAQRALSDHPAKPLTLPQRRDLAKSVELSVEAITRIYGVQGYEFERSRNIAEWLGVPEAGLPAELAATEKNNGLTDGQLQSARARANGFLTSVQERAKKALERSGDIEPGSGGLF